MSARSASWLPEANVTCYIKHNHDQSHTAMSTHTSQHSRDQYQRVNAIKCVKHACLWIMFASPGNSKPPSGYFCKTDRIAFQFLCPHFSSSLILFPHFESSSASKLGC